MEEKWKKIEKWPNYMVSNTGKVLSIVRDKVLKTRVVDGYEYVSLERDGKWIHIRLHRLVAEAFVQGWFKGAVVTHLDGVQTNNNSDNLKWNSKAKHIKYLQSIGLNPTRRRIWKNSDTGEVVKLYFERIKKR